MLKRVIHPGPDEVRWAGLAAMIGGALGVLNAPFYSLAYFATDEGDPGAGSFWAEPAADLLEPLLTFASADVVRVTYGKVWLFVWAGMLVGLIGLHARHAGRGGRLERWGFRVNLAGLALLTIGAFVSFWLGVRGVDFGAFILFPGLLLVAIGAPIFGVGAWRVGVAPRTGALLLAVGGPAIIVISEIATLGGGFILLYIAWAVVGHAL
jgi:hypothetical protein